MRRSLGLLVFAFLMPHAAHAAVVINEVAWMGTSVNSNAEWIELANAGSAPVDLSGWTLTSSTGSPSITLSGSIAAGGYFLLERTNDDSVPGVAADQLYAGALSNSGATLTLRTAASALEDEVIGGTNWANIGGDNASKYTAQRTSTGWTTALGTPRALNAGAASGSSSASAASSTPASSASGASTAESAEVAAYVAPSGFSLEIAGPSEAIVESPARFAVRAPKNESLAEVSWSFGDGSSASGTVTEKTYRYPGTYVVAATAQRGTDTGRDDIVVTVRKAAVRIAGVSDEGIRVANDSNSRLDLSGWRLYAEGRSFLIPIGTMLLPRAEVLFPHAVTNLPIAFSASLAYPSGIPAAAFAAPPSASPEAQPQSAPAGSYSIQTVEFTEAPNESNPAHEPKVVRAPVPVTEVIETGAADAQAPLPGEAASGGLFDSPWTYGLMGVMLLAAGAFILI